MIIYIDMDGVICNYEYSYNLMRKINPAIRFPQSKKKFWTDLNPIEGAIYAVNILRKKHQVYILTAPSTKNSESYSGKRIWIKKHFDMDMVERLILCNYKGLLDGDVLIDDNHKGKGQEDFKGQLILFGSKDFPTWDDVLKNKLLWRV